MPGNLTLDSGLVEKLRLQLDLARKKGSYVSLTALQEAAAYSLVAENEGMRKSQIKEAQPFLYDLLGGEEGIVRTFRSLGSQGRIVERPDPNDARGKRYSANYGKMPKYLLNLGNFPRKCSMAPDETRAAALVALHSLGKATALRAFQNRIAEFESRKTQAVRRIESAVAETEKLYLDLLMQLYKQHPEALNDAYQAFIFGESGGITGIHEAAKNPEIMGAVEKAASRIAGA